MEHTLITEQARRWAAEPFEPAAFEVGRNDILRFARAVGATDPVHTDAGAARAAGYRDLLAPPYFPYAIRMHAAHLAGRGRIEADGSASEDVPPLDVKRAMAGETEIEMGVPVVAGDTITMHKEIVAIYEKVGRSGPMAFVKTQFTFRNQRSELVMRERFTRIYR
ncbi:MAG: MaoC family dehydratase N-terminal domain-containing protein [Acidimicrobiaceae bacterium]|nr:MaoC family dehydratase N-terminal domain-containing protein [Acidimicrobiaceae bacterium]